MQGERVVQPLGSLRGRFDFPHYKSDIVFGVYEKRLPVQIQKIVEAVISLTLHTQWLSLIDNQCKFRPLYGSKFRQVPLLEGSFGGTIQMVNRYGDGLHRLRQFDKPGMVRKEQYLSLP